MNPSETRRRYRECARELTVRYGNIIIPEHAPVQMAEGGAFVEAVIWMAEDDTMKNTKSRITVVTAPGDIRFRGVIAFEYTVDENVHDLVGLTVRCEQDGRVVYGAGGYPIQTTFVLGPTALWTGGPATGKAILVHFRANDPSRDRVLAECDFTVLG